MSEIFFRDGHRMGCAPRLFIAILLALASLVAYFLSTNNVKNPATGRMQRISLSPNEEIALGLNAAPEMARQYGGLYPDEALQQKLQGIGDRLVQANSDLSQSPYQFKFHLLADPSTINAFALPGGQIFITYGLFKLLPEDAEIAGVLAHETVHVVGRHSNEQMAKAQLSQGLVNAAVVAGGDDYGGATGQMAAFVSQLTNTSYSREHELESDKFAVRLLKQANYDPAALIRVMEVLKSASHGDTPPEFLSTHPDPGNRIERIKEHLKEDSPTP